MKAALLLASLAVSAADTPYIGHYGTRLIPPDGLKVVRTTFGEHGDELVMLGPVPGRTTAVLRVSLKAVSGERLEPAAKRLLSQAKKEGVALKPAEPGEGARVWTSKSPPAAFALREDDEYLFQVNGPDRASVLSVLRGLSQPPLKRWKEAVAEARKAGGDPFKPDLSPPKAFKGRLFEVPVPEGYTFQSSADEKGETVILFPLKHAALLTSRALRDAALYGSFEIVQVQATKKELPLRRAMEKLAEYHVTKHKLASRDFKLEQTHDGWNLDRLRPVFLRHAGRETAKAQVIVIGGEKGLTDRVARSIK